MLLPDIGATSVSADLVAVLSEAIIGWFSGAMVGVAEGITSVGVGEGSLLRVP